MALTVNLDSYLLPSTNLRSAHGSREMKKFLHFNTIEEFSRKSSNARHEMSTVLHSPIKYESKIQATGNSTNNSLEIPQQKKNNANIQTSSIKKLGSPKVFGVSKIKQFEPF